MEKQKKEEKFDDFDDIVNEVCLRNFNKDDENMILYDI